MIFNDIAGMLLNAYNIGAPLGKISELTTGVKSLGGLLKAIFTPDGPDGKLFQTVLAARDATLEFFNFTDLQEVQLHSGRHPTNGWLVTPLEEEQIVEGRPVRLQNRFPPLATNCSSLAS